jgi:hypothetical protein
MRRLACADDYNKVMAVERHGDCLVAERKSIAGVGFEVGLHDVEEEGAASSFENDLNELIETPFAASLTWQKVERGSCAELDQADGLSIYGFARHLQRRNVATLSFMKQENVRFTQNNITSLTDEEQNMHRWISETPSGANLLFRDAALDITLPNDADGINIMVCRTPIPLRSSTNPTLMISYPGHDSIFGKMFHSLRTWWLTLDRYCGVFIVAGGPPGFSNESVEEAVAQVINRRYLVQMLHGDARFLLVDDPYVDCDLDWAGFVLDHRTTRRSRYRAKI